MFRNLLIAAVGAAAAATAHAQSEASQPRVVGDPMPKPLSASIAVYSEYELRGISQTSEKPAVQGTLDYTLPSGFHAGTFVSNSRWLKDTAEQNGFSTGNKVEWDVYAGYRFHVTRDLLLDAGVRHYDFPSSGDFDPKPNTTEVYLGATWGIATVRYFYSVDDSFGVPDSKGSDYAELALRYPIPSMPRLTLEGLVGHQSYRRHGDLDYTVWKAGASYAFTPTLRAGVYGKGTDADSAPYTVKGKDWSKDRMVAFVSYTF